MDSYVFFINIGVNFNPHFLVQKYKCKCLNTLNIEFWDFLTSEFWSSEKDFQSHFIHTTFTYNDLLFPFIVLNFHCKVWFYCWEKLKSHILSFLLKWFHNNQATAKTLILNYTITQLLYCNLNLIQYHTATLSVAFTVHQFLKYSTKNYSTRSFPINAVTICLSVQPYHE